MRFIKSKITDALKHQYNPVAIVWSDEEPEDAMQLHRAVGHAFYLFSQLAKQARPGLDRTTRDSRRETG